MEEAKKIFCPLPFIGVHLRISGEITPCCLTDLPVVQGKFKPRNISEGNIDYCRNADDMKKLRLSFLNGEKNNVCQKCWYHEDNGWHSTRYYTAKNCDFKYEDAVAHTEADGSINDVPILNWDIRDTNLCNMKCISCSGHHSSLFNAEAIAHGLNTFRNGDKALLLASDHANHDYKQDIIDHLPEAKYFYFAGGEPLISETHWWILDWLIEHNKTDVKIAYNSNMLRLDWKGRDVLDVWSKFDDVGLGASIDAVGARAEYVRGGTVWNKVSDNFKRARGLLGQSGKIAVCGGLLNFGGLKELFKWAHDECGCEPESVVYHNWITRPPWLDVRLLPQSYRISVFEDMDPLLKQWGYDQSVGYAELKDLSYAEQIDNPDALKNLRNEISRLDKIRNTNWQTVCPELGLIIEK